MSVHRRVAVGILVLAAGACAGGGNASGTSAPTTTQPATSTTSVPPPGVVAVLDVDHRPSGIVVADDRLWTEDHAWTRRVYAVDPATGESLVDIEVARPCDVAATEGRIWVADLDGGSLIWIDRATLEPGGEIPELSGPCGLQVVDGALWFAVDTGLGRLDVESGEVTIADLGGGAFPGSGSPFWVADYQTGELMRVDTATGEVLLSLPHPEGSFEGPAVATGFGSLWVGGRSLYRLDATTGDVVADIATIPVTRLLVTSSGVWVTSYSGGTVARLDPSTNQVVYLVTLGGNPNGIAEGLGSIWVTDTARGLIFRIDPEAVGVAEP